MENFTIKEVLKNAYGTDNVLIKNEKREVMHEWLPVNRLSRSEMNYNIKEYDFIKEDTDTTGYYIFTVEDIA